MHTTSCDKDVFFSFIVISQLRRPIKQKFSQVYYFMHMLRQHQVRRLVFDNYQQCPESLKKCFEVFVNYMRPIYVVLPCNISNTSCCVGNLNIVKDGIKINYSFCSNHPSFSLLVLNNEIILMPTVVKVTVTTNYIYTNTNQFCGKSDELSITRL